MKKFNLLLCTFIVLLAAACSGSNAYDPKVCDELKTKIDNHEQLSEKDYGIMIDQMVAASKEVKKMRDKMGDDAAKGSEMLKDEAFQETATYAMGFAFYIGSHQNELSEANIKKLVKAKEELEALNDKE